MGFPALGFLIVFIGGGVGSALRHGINVLCMRFGSAFPYATAIENISGSIVMGLLAGYFAFKSDVLSQHVRLFLTTGILGGYTTFSTYSLDAMLLYERGEFGLAALYVIGSVALGVGGLAIGLIAMRQFA